jgi:hypothetical protein
MSWLSYLGLRSNCSVQGAQRSAMPWMMGDEEVAQDKAASSGGFALLLTFTAPVIVAWGGSYTPDGRGKACPRNGKLDSTSGRIPSMQTVSSSL